MGTRGAYGLRKDGTDKVTYNHFDSYPDGLGVDILEDLRETSREQLIATFDRITLVDSDAEPSLEEQERLGVARYTNGDVSTGSDWYSMLREAQGSLRPWTHDGLSVMCDSAAFLADSLFCEFAYIVNLDDGTLEFYRGFNKDPDAPGRYAALGADRAAEYKKSIGDAYFGVRLVQAFPLDEVAAGKVTASQLEQLLGAEPEM